MEYVNKYPPYSLQGNEEYVNINNFEQIVYCRIEKNDSLYIILVFSVPFCYAQTVFYIW